MHRRPHLSDEHRGRKGGYAETADQIFGRVDLPDKRRAAKSGMAAGLVGGLAMLATLGVSYGLTGSYPLLPLQVMVYGLTGDAGLAGSAAGAVSGMVLLLIGAGALGALFGLIMAVLVGKLGLFGAAGVGMTYGLLTWIVLQFVVLSFVAPNVILLYDQNALALAHAVYGICLGLFGRAYHKD